jgi:hypothetical protein
MPNGTNYAQVFAVQLPTTLLALSAAGPGSATFGISGNVTSSQVTKATFVPDSTGRVSRLDLTVSGKSGTVGNMTITMPRSSVAGGVVPDVQVNGVRAAQQSYTEDSTNYYVNVLVHFSTDQVSVLFSAPSGTGATTSPATTSGGQTTAVTTPAGSGNSSGGGIPEFPAQLVPAIVLAVLVVASYLALRRRAPT